MDAVTTAELMTADEFMALPEPPDGPSCRQLIEGEVVVNSASWMHNDSLLTVVFALRTWVRGGAGRGAANVELDVEIDGRNVYKPDVVWYREGRAPTRPDLSPYLPPDIAVEIRSPSTWRFDVGAKKRNYELRGVPELWLVDTAADVVLIFRRSSAKSPIFDVSEELDASATLTTPLLPGFALPVAAIFGG